MTATPWWRCSAIELHASVQAGECNVTEIATACMERVAQLEPSVQAWAWCNPQQVMRAAADVDHTLPLAGVLIGIKDIIDTADMPTAYGAELYRHHLPSHDAELVRRLRAAGALIAGKTVTTEFAYAAPGPTRNPHHLAHTPGGSSSGSAAAVAAGMVPVAISSQTGGSTIRPAAYCGVAGFKPSYGSIDSTGMKALAPASDTAGIHARSVDDIALILPVLSDLPVPSISASPPPSLRMAWFPGPHDAEASAEARASLLMARSLLSENGFNIGPISLPLEEMAALAEINRLIMAFEAASSLRTEYERSRMKLTPQTRDLIERGHSITVSEYKNALVKVGRGREMLAQAMHGFDLLMTYSAPGAAPLATDGTGSSVFNRAWSTLGVPCLSLPCGCSENSNLPLGVQLIAPMAADYRLLETGRVIERVLCAATDSAVDHLAGC
ncbi:amidase [Herbaspirillum autotrophicum]|uniref:amidase n=1 Tax=Herbaspirillum autotrophicum TaxID=180195 RepID=UPI00067E5725|nr:amidase [Herbaspirillum autotrophicum]